MAKASKAAKPAKQKTEKVIVTEQMLIDNPALAESGVEVGDEIELPATSEKKHYQEVKVEIKANIKDGKVVGKTFEKLKVVRECVKITDEEAETLNAGVLDGPNTITSMYFKAE